MKGTGTMLLKIIIILSCPVLCFDIALCVVDAICEFASILVFVVFSFFLANFLVCIFAAVFHFWFLRFDFAISMWGR